MRYFNLRRFAFLLMIMVTCLLVLLTVGEIYGTVQRRHMAEELEHTLSALNMQLNIQLQQDERRWLIAVRPAAKPPDAMNAAPQEIKVRSVKAQVRTLAPGVRQLRFVPTA